MRHIMIVDDSATARMFIRKCLEIAGCRNDEFYEAQNGEEAFSLLQKKSADLVITDLNMPVMGGQELLKKIRESDLYRLLPVLVITSAQNQAKEEELKALKATAVLAKPVSPAKMLEVLKTLQS